MNSKYTLGLACALLMGGNSLPAVATNSGLTESQWLANLGKTEQQYGANDTRTAEMMLAVGNYYHAHKQFDKEQPLYQKAMAVFEKRPGKNEDLLRFYCDQLARAYSDEGKYTQAESLFNKSIAIGERIPGQDKTYVLPNTLLGLSQVYIAEGRYGDAENALKKRLAMRHRFINYGQVDPALLDLANLYTKWGKFDLAKKTFDELFKITPMPSAVKQAYAAFAMQAGNQQSQPLQTN